MRATIIREQENGRNYSGEYSGEKALHSAYIAVSGNRQPVVVKVWRPWSRNGSTIYASIWVYDKASGTHTAGHGKAGGYGYHKPSAAVGAAIAAAGIKLDKDIDGRGDSAIEEAVVAIGRAVTGKTCHVVVV